MKLVVLTSIVLSLFAARAHNVPNVTFAADETALTGPYSVPAGYVRLVLDNRDDAMRAHGIFRVREGASLESAKKLVTRVFSSEEVSHEEEERLVDRFYGGAVFVPPGTQGEVGVALKPGRYVVYADEVTERGPAITPAYITTLSVTPSNYSAEPPTPDYTVKLVDHAFAFLADVRSGQHLFRVENAGRQTHMMFVAKLLPGKTLRDVQAEVRGEAEAPVVEPETSGVHGVGPGIYNDVVFDLTPGQYAAVCFVTDPETGVPHAMMGMTQTFTVAASGR